MRKGIVVAMVCTLVALGIFACSGGGGGNSSDCAAPALDATGTWCITITNTNNNCGNPLDSTPYPAVYTQTGSNVTATAYGATYTGTMCGSTVHMTGNNNGFNISIYTTFSDAAHAGGTSTYTSTACNGVDTMSAVKGTCP